MRLRQNALSAKHAANQEGNSMNAQINTATDDEARWQGIMTKNATLDGSYLFAVKTTGIYCRPSCPSRTPNRINVQFFNTAEEALKSGFRACLRCAPDGVTKHQQQTTAIMQACRIIENSETRITLNALAEQVGLSPQHFHRVFKDVTGVTPHDYYKARQIAQIGQSLQTNGTVTDAMYAAGFNSSGRFYENTHAMLGMTPTAYKAGGQNEVIRVAVRTCALGLVLVAATGRGICTIEFGDDKALLEEALFKRFPKATIIAKDAQFSDWLAQLLAHIQLPQKALQLPLDIRGTVFQQQVWNALQAIPLGQTVSYSEVAKQIGKLKAVRAVATACASNVLALAIPCHRVVRGNGALSGYRWGVERKRKILDAEAKSE
jgi:AraC family transcriptional regulator, regulatory protein of adaptative response / methylated-DNA-[protein]-cysteine methyltransferase